MAEILSAVFTYPFFAQQKYWLWVKITFDVAEVVEVTCSKIIARACKQTG